jgi:hypothetical protein
LLSRYLTTEIAREARDQQSTNQGENNIFSMLYTVPIAVRANTNTAAAGAAGGGGGGGSGGPTIAQINRSTLNTAFSNIVSPVNATCPISRDEFSDDSEITMIRGCNHIFNRASLREWFISHSTCPMCRSDIREYRVPAPMHLQSERRSNEHNISIDRVDENELTFSYDLPMQYNNEQVYHDIINTISDMTRQTSQPNHDDDDNDDDDIMEVD